MTDDTELTRVRGENMLAMQLAAAHISEQEKRIDALLAEVERLREAAEFYRIAMVSNNQALTGALEHARDLHEQSDREAEIAAIAVKKAIAAREENAALREIARAMASGDATFRDNIYEYEHCCFCTGKEADSAEAIEHTADCPVTKARALLGTDAADNKE